MLAAFTSLSDEQNNFVKLARIVLDIFPDCLRKLFKSLWDKKHQPKEWCSGRESDVLYSELPDGVKGAARKKGILERLEKGNDKKWDTSTAVFVILDAGLKLVDDKCRDGKEWSPPLSRSEKIRTLQNIRNGVFGHPESMSCSSDIFDETISKIKSISEGIFSEDAIKKIDEIVNSCIEIEDYNKLKQDMKGELKNVA